MMVLTFRDVSKFSSVNTAIHLLGLIKIFKIKLNSLVEIGVRWINIFSLGHSEFSRFIFTIMF